MTPEPKSAPVVTQADRDAAARIYQDRRDHDMHGWVLRGIADADPIVQAFARHRTATEAASAAEVAELREALERLSDAVDDARQIEGVANIAGLTDAFNAAEALLASAKPADEQGVG